MGLEKHVIVWTLHVRSHTNHWTSAYPTTLASFEKWIKLGIFSLPKQTSADLSLLLKLPMQNSEA